MKEQKRYKVEFRTSNYHTVGNISVDYETIRKDFQSSDFADIIEATDKRVYDQYVDGCTIFHLTENQYKKFIRILNTYPVS